MVGQTVGKYRIQDRVGRGGMGTVYRAIDETLHREVAIKVLNTELNDPGVARRFRSEAVTVARLNHPGIAMVYELVQHEGQWLMVMEFVQGETLENYLARKGILPVEDAASICMRVLDALAHAHGVGVIHRDLKPANIMVTGSGAVKITDFGIARVVGTEHLTSAGFMIGTPAYMAPEQVLGQEIDARADLYSMGVVLFHLTTGKLPFKGDTPMQIAQSRLHDQPTPVRSVRQELPAWLGQVLDIALSRAADRRYQTAPLFKDALQRGLENRVPQAAVPSADVPSDFLATAAPNSLPIPAPAPAVARSASPPASPRPSAEPTMIASTADTTKVDRPAPSKALFAALALVVVVLLAGAGWWMMRSRAPEAVPPADLATQPESSPGSEPSGQDAPVVSEPLAPLTTETVPAAPTREGAASGAPSPDAPVPSAPGVPAIATPGSAAAAPPPGATGSRANTTPGSTSASPATGTAGARGRGRANAAAEPHTAFQNLRVLVVKGRNSQEQDSVLHFYGGNISIVVDKGTTTLAAIPYKDLRAATYVRAKDPKWNATLAAPPANLDVPGGIFRSARHWLVLQSAQTFIIVRLNDSDFQGILDTVNARTGVKVEQPASGG